MVDHHLTFYEEYTTSGNRVRTEPAQSKKKRSEPSSSPFPSPVNRSACFAHCCFLLIIIIIFSCFNPFFAFFPHRRALSHANRKYYLTKICHLSPWLPTFSDKPWSSQQMPAPNVKRKKRVFDHTIGFL